METLSLRNRYNLKELELNALLEITQAINSNLPEASLYKIYDFTLRGNLNIRKLALYVFDDRWNCKVNYGTATNFFTKKLPEEFEAYKTLTTINKNREDRFEEFECVIPVSHKSQILALVFVGDLDHEDEEIRNSAMRFIQALSNIIIVAIENKKLARKQLEQEALRKEIEIASDVQQFLFPEKLPYDAHIKVEASYLPHDRVGGDYYDFIPVSDHQFIICIADVSGKGIPAALMMSNFQASLRTMVRQTTNLKRIIEELNFQVLVNAKGEKFITFFIAIYDSMEKKLVYINSGHTPPILVDRDKGLSLLEEGSTILGILNPLPFINETILRDVRDFLLFCYTDGLTETDNEKDEEFGIERLIDYFENNAHKDLKEIHQDIIINLDHFKESKGYRDDITMLSCQVNT